MNTVTVFKAFVGLLAALAFAYLMMLALPIALTAVASGRGVTLSGLEVGANKTCEHAHEIIANAASNNEVALYKDSIDRLLAYRDFELLRAAGQSKAADAATPKQGDPLDGYLKDALKAQIEIGKSRQEALIAVTKWCLERAPEDGKITWPVAAAISFITAVLSLLIYFSIAKICETLKPRDKLFS